MNWILMGCKCSGKSTMGALLAKKWGKPFIDTDVCIKNLFPLKKSLSCFELYTIFGEKIFRSMEKKAIYSLATVQDSVIATGGGSFVDMDNRQFLKKLGTLVYLYIPYSIFLKRIKALQRPYLLHEDLKKVYCMRDKIFSKICDKRIDLSEKTIEDALIEYTNG